jgi:hypothetical protein
VYDRRVRTRVGVQRAVDVSHRLTSAFRVHDKRREVFDFCPTERRRAGAPRVGLNASLPRLIHPAFHPHHSSLP